MSDTTGDATKNKSRYIKKSNQFQKLGYNPEVTLVENEYDELGQLKIKKLGRKIDYDNHSEFSYTDIPVDQIEYTYNVRGWLRGVNKDYARDENGGNSWFGEEICYDFGFDVPQFNGNISGVRWRTKDDDEQRAYGFTYDGVNRLLQADFRQFTDATWNLDAGVDFSVGNINYDANGNLLTMQQMGLKLNSSEMIDDLEYGYNSNSNKLNYVKDNSNDEESTLGDFKEHDNDDSQDYNYDLNGNLVLDNNKGISSITYNYLNLPETVVFEDKGTITYTYDASGNKMRKVTVDNTVDNQTPVTTTTDYVGPFVYENGMLRYILHEEGRIRPRRPYNHGDPVYNNNPEADVEAESEKMYKLNGSTGSKTGLGIVLKVMTGDEVDIISKSYYHLNNSETPPLSVVLQTTMDAMKNQNSNAHKKQYHPSLSLVLQKKPVLTGMEKINCVKLFSV